MSKAEFERHVLNVVFTKKQDYMQLSVDMTVSLQRAAGVTCGKVCSLNLVQSWYCIIRFRGGPGTMTEM